MQNPPVAPHPLRVKAKALTRSSKSLHDLVSPHCPLLPGPHRSPHLCSLCFCHMGLADVPQTDQTHCCSRAFALVSSCLLFPRHPRGCSLTNFRSHRTWHLLGEVLASSPLHIAPNSTLTPHPPSLLHFPLGSLSPFDIITIWCVYMCVCIVCMHINTNVCNLFIVRHFLLARKVHEGRDLFLTAITPTAQNGAEHRKVLKKYFLSEWIIYLYSFNKC